MTKTKDKTRKLVYLIIQFLISRATSSAAEANYRAQQQRNKK
jgi:hypothetical protein